jgi:DNA adenine methylase
MDFVKPLIKWVGGKTQIIDRVLQSFPDKLNNYHEPFVGGGSVLLAFLSLVKDGQIKIEGNVYASDKNDRLISLYKNIQQYPGMVINELQTIVEEYSQVPYDVEEGRKLNRKPLSKNEALECQESYYYWIRKMYNGLSKEEQTSCKSTAYFIFLNKTCFRGVYREGPNGFNVPFGHYKNPGIFDEDHILIVSSLIENVIFTSQSFETSLTQITANDFIYMDPPYAPENSKSFVGYTADGFNEQFHHNLFDLCSKIRNIPNVSYVMSNADVELVRNNFPEDVFNMQVISCKRSINSKKPSSKTNEVIIKWG